MEDTFDTVMMEVYGGESMKMAKNMENQLSIFEMVLSYLPFSFRMELGLRVMTMIDWII